MNGILIPQKAKLTKYKNHPARPVKAGRWFPWSQNTRGACARITPPAILRANRERNAYCIVLIAFSASR